ncbi:conserved hypothetical protein [Renibacterium salmoninarum ATCC 33209]|uniref:Transcription factor zinc-finger domain-containing protein n=1 Tax=Renibacterium salmoninarum (strain ATCC 33209 / DSM 20767 / JCM 11484 / NBRC 15589 / NCIMB 2235) TaxID=288705 RepID=A9WTI6_RENSM|nr:zf-TFIIB domain-containing protein [Renibacterium salmoninarum]ABY24507.1 conserved hypothetical protein [Renibacterium salmoninarum ATCC 33209]
MKCPKCGETMRSYERNGVMIDQCEGCRGIFLDRGELEQLMDAESRFGSAQQGQKNQGFGGGYGGFSGGHSGGRGNKGGGHGNNSGGHGNNGNNGRR